jgi:lipopolysaccharide export system protein LptA
MVHDQPDPKGGPPARAVGRAEIVTYNVATGEVELKGTPRVQQGLNTQVATSPDTVMILNQNGQLTTRGPSRTDIRQDPKAEEGEKKPEASPSQ